MKTFLKIVVTATVATAILHAVAYLIITCTSCAMEIGQYMMYAFGILTALSMGCVTIDPDSKISKFLFGLFFVAIYCAMQGLSICTMMH